MYLSKIYLALLMFIYVSVQNAGGDEPLRVRKEQSKRESLAFPEKSLIEYGSTKWRTYRNIKGIDAVLFSSDGKFYVTFSRNKALHVFELLTGKSVQLIDDGLDLLPVAISHNNRLLAYRKRNKLYMFDLLERQILWSINLPDQKIKGSFSPADQVFIVSQQLCATLYDPKKGARLREYQIADNGKGFVFLSECSGLVGKVHASGKVECWDVESGKLRRKLENVPSTNVKFHSPDGKSITIYGFRENDFFVLHPNKKIQTFALPEERSSGWTGFLHKTNTLVSVSQGGDVLCFDLEKRELREKISSAYLIRDFFISPKNGWLVLVFENEICCYSLPTFRQVKLHAPSIKSAILDIQIVADEKLLIVRDGETLRVWDTRTGRCLNSLVGHSSDVKSLVVSEFNNIVMSSGRFDRSVQLWNAANGSHLETVEYPLEHVSDFAITPDGNRIAIMGFQFLKGSRTFVHDIAKRAKIGYVDTGLNLFGKGHCQGLRLAFCDRGEILFIPHMGDYVAFFYDIKSKKKWQENLPEWCGIEDFAVSPIGNWICMHVKPNYQYEMDKRYSELTLVYKLENKSLRLVHQLPFGGKTTFSRDGKLMAICDNKDVVRLVETISGEVIERKTNP